MMASAFVTRLWTTPGRTGERQGPTRLRCATAAEVSCRLLREFANPVLQKLSCGRLLREVERARICRHSFRQASELAQTVGSCGVSGDPGPQDAISSRPGRRRTHARGRSDSRWPCGRVPPVPGSDHRRGREAVLPVGGTSPVEASRPAVLQKRNGLRPLQRRPNDLNQRGRLNR
jgi:hypothetical protein